MLLEKREKPFDDERYLYNPRSTDTTSSYLWRPDRSVF